MPQNIRYRSFSISATVTLSLLILLVQSASAETPSVNYALRIQPILSNNCFACHGPDEASREADLRLDLRDEATADAIVPGDAAASELIRRILSEDPDEMMPPPAAKKPHLTPQQIELLKQWVDQGAEYSEHWAYTKIGRSEVPQVKTPDDVANPIDAFIVKRLEARDLTPSPAADRRTQLRRLSFDLTGLPPSAAQVAAFEADTSPAAYEQAVDRLLASRHYGERMALNWLDLVRYADTVGYHGDQGQSISPYRDWVIKAFNDNMPYDQFTREQLAGDLLENPTVDQKIASGYNRVLQTSQEGGAQDKEYLAKYAADRVRNVSGVWLGVTMGCAECHDHKFDPFTTKEFYQFEAFFADIKEVGYWGKSPVTEISTRLPEMDVHSPIDRMRLAELDQQIAELASDESQAARLAELQTKRKTLAEQKRATMITEAVEPRPIRVLARGNWQDDSGEIVEPATPASLNPMKVAGRRANRLDLANWLMDPENPLTARVTVNRFWKLTFGNGLARTLDDLGAQGTPPVHPELLDWLAAEFIASDWDTKRIMKLIVMSNAYRQSSRSTAEMRESDPYNELLARQSRYRLEAEMLRDNALSVSGLLVPTIGGPSVRPYQPEGYLEHLNFPRRTYQPSMDENQYRRGLYTYWQRQFLHPSMKAFDAPTREECTVERPHSNNAIQALTLLNDPSYVEAARVLATRIVREGGKTPAEKVRYAYERTLQRQPTARETATLTALFYKHRENYDAHADDAEALLATGIYEPTDDMDRGALAAWTSVARVMLNLHETITRN